MSNTMSRRALIAAGASTAIAPSALANAIEPVSQPLTFLLVHGTWHGGWVWRDVAARLRSAGHRVVTPTLTGCGEREHLSGPDVGLETHITDLVNVIRFEELTNIIVVGHSFTGVAMTGLIDRMPDNIRHAVYFDAIVPSEIRRAGVPRDADGRLPEWFVERSQHFVDGYKMDLWRDYPIDMLLLPDHPQAERVRRLITTHPAKTWTDELELKNGGWQNVARTFIHCVGQAYRMSSEKMVGPARGPGWNFIELDVPRDGMITHPELVAETLLGIGT
ncbi:MAG: alpha/beta fold hydrolase [Pseudomonadota bacterium]